MSEEDSGLQPSSEAMAQQRLQLFETAAQARQRLKDTIGFVPAEDSHLEDRSALCVAMTPDGRGGYYYGFGSQLNTALYDPVPADTQEGAALYKTAQELLLDNEIFLNTLSSMDGRWWIFHPIEAAIENKLREVYRASGAFGRMDILNCTLQELSESELYTLMYTLSSVAAFTGSKAMQRFQGIVLVEENDMPPESEGSLGFYNAPAGVMGVNMTFVRQKGAEMMQRYTKYFEKNPHVNNLAIIIAHELGHITDVQTVDEAEKRGLSKDNIWWNDYAGRTQDFSHFQQGLGWNSSIESPENKNPFTRWKFEDENIEPPPTDYAYTNPQEDFAESFTILSLGGDSADIPIRRQIMHDVLRDMEQESHTGPERISLHKYDPDSVYSPGGRLTSPLPLRVGLERKSTQQ